MELPVYPLKENSLVCIDLIHAESRHFAPGLGRVVTVLQILGREDERSEEHTSATHESTCSGTICTLFHGEIIHRHMRLDQYKIVERHLKSRVRCSRPSEGLLDVGAKWQYSSSSGSITATHYNREWPDDFHHLGSAVFGDEMLSV